MSDYLWKLAVCLVVIVAWVVIVAVGCWWIGRPARQERKLEMGRPWHERMGPVELTRQDGSVEIHSGDRLSISFADGQYTGAKEQW